MFWITPAVLVAALLFSARTDLAPQVHRLLATQWRVFDADPLPVDMIQYIYDMGVVDADNDGNLDLYTANHNYRQFLFLGIGGGRFRDVLSEWKLDQSVSMPGIEQSSVEPVELTPHPRGDRRLPPPRPWRPRPRARPSPPPRRSRRLLPLRAPLRARAPCRRAPGAP